MYIDFCKSMQAPVSINLVFFLWVKKSLKWPSKEAGLDRRIKIEKRWARGPESARTPAVTLFIPYSSWFSASLFQPFFIPLRPSLSRSVWWINTTTTKPLYPPSAREYAMPRDRFGARAYDVQPPINQTSSSLYHCGVCLNPESHYWVLKSCELIISTYFFGKLFSFFATSDENFIREKKRRGKFLIFFFQTSFSNIMFSRWILKWFQQPVTKHDAGLRRVQKKKISACWF